VRDVTKRRESEERLRSQSRELALLHQVRTAVACELEVPGVLLRACLVRFMLLSLAA
jgi:hypothetical protein